MDAESLRETIARVIAPWAFGIQDDLATTPPVDADDPRLFDPWPAVIEDAFAKADDVLALLPPSGSEGWKPITMQDVRLAVGEGPLSATDVLTGANAELRRRAHPAGRP